MPHLFEPLHPRSLRGVKRQYLTQLSDSSATATGKNVLHRLTFDSLPIELQVLIFSFCLPSFPRFNAREAPIVLARVCRTWRSIILSTPKLWSSFEVEIQGSGTSGLLHDTRLLHKMKLWLERSSCYPLSIRLVHNPVTRVSDDRSAPFLVELVLEARRWRNAHFILPAASIAQLQFFSPNSLPTLQSLTVKVTGLRSSQSDPPLNILAMNIPWRQLTGLNLQLEPSNLLTLDDGLKILAKMVNLKHSTLHLECTWDWSNIQRDRLSFPALETLQLILQGDHTASASTGALTERPEACLVQFLNLLCLPKLRALHLKWLGNSDMEPWSLSHPDFLGFLRASADTLHELTLTYLPIAENELLECLHEVPDLTHLDLRFALNEGANDPITNRLLVACTIKGSTGSTGLSRQANVDTCLLLPRLEHVNLQCHGALYANATLLTFIQSRWKSNDVQTTTTRRRLRSFRLLSMKPVPSEVEKHVKLWQENGLEIDIQCLVIR